MSGQWDVLSRMPFLAPGIREKQPDRDETSDCTTWPSEGYSRADARAKNGIVEAGTRMEMKAWRKRTYICCIDKQKGN